MAGRGEAAAIGIDLGTTYSCVDIWQHGRVEIIANDQGNRTTPCVAFTDVQCLTGEAAKNQTATNPANIVFGTKRLMGRRFSEPRVQADMKLRPFKITLGSISDKPMISVTYKGEARNFSAEVIKLLAIQIKKKELQLIENPKSSLTS